MADGNPTSSAAQEESDFSETIRKIVAAAIGIIIIIALVLLAKWVGDRIRERFVSKTPTTNVQVIPPEESPTPEPTHQGRKVSTLSAIPATGPNDANYLILAFLTLAGSSSLLLAKRFSLQ